MLYYVKRETLKIKRMKSEKHQTFMKTYGCLLEGVRVRHLGLTIAVLTPIVDLLQALVIAVSVTQLLDWPIFTIFMFNFLI